MAGMRDILIHSYENADLGEIWKTIRDVMPKIAIHLSKI
jgi:uncharacterized protein with HEPN domain